MILWISANSLFLHLLSPLSTLPEKAMAPNTSTLAWKIPWMEEPGGLQSMGSLRVGQTERLHFHFSLACIGEGNGNPLQWSCLEKPGDGGAWWAAVYRVAQSQTRLTQLSSNWERASLHHKASAVVGSLWRAATSFSWAFFQLLRSVVAPATTGSFACAVLSAWMYIGMTWRCPDHISDPLNQDLMVGSRHQLLLMFPRGFQRAPQPENPFPSILSACLPACVTPAPLCLPCLMILLQRHTSWHFPAPALSHIPLGASTSPVETTHGS